MRKSPPKHLEPRRSAPAAWRGRRRLVSLFAAAAVALALLVVGYGQGRWGQGGGDASPTTLLRATPAGEPATTTTTTTTTSTTMPPPAGLLADPGFDAGLGAWRPVGGARLARVAAGRGGGSAARVTAGPGPRPGLALAGVGPASVGTTYEGQVWVRGSRPGLTVEVRLAEVVAGTRLATDTVGVVLTDTAWRRVDFSHAAHSEGARLSLQIVAPELGPNGRLLVDDVRIQQGGN
jgi:hypothetical protein